MRYFATTAYFFLAFALLTTTASATSLMMPGNAGLRSDVELLADAGIISGPVTTWPLSWTQVAADLEHVPDDAHLSPAVAGALRRVRARLQLNEQSTRAGVYARGGTRPQFLRSFDDTPRAKAETGAYLDWMYGRLSGRLQASYAVDPEDGKEARLDGSWLGITMGNWMLAGGFLDRYWGPSWQGGLIMSNNARPRAGVTLRRIRTTPFESKWLSWIGPWNFTIFTERLEHARAHPNTLLLGYRFAFKPFQSLEIGLSRTSLIGGEGHHLGFDNVTDALIGVKTRSDSSKETDSLGGLDMRWKLPGLNAAVYGELVAEDKHGNHPIKFMNQEGIEIWGPIGHAGASWRLVYERADTKAGNYGVAYNNHDFPTGYRYRGRSLGYPADGDALLHSLRAIYVTPRGSSFRLVATTGKVNRTAHHDPSAAQHNALTQQYEKIDAVDLGYSKQYNWGRLDLGLGLTHHDYDVGNMTKGHAWIGLSRDF